MDRGITQHLMPAEMEHLRQWHELEHRWQLTLNALERAAWHAKRAEELAWIVHLGKPIS